MIDPYLSSEDREWVEKFNVAVEDVIAKNGVSMDLNLFVIADGIGLDLSTLHKEGTLMYALWVALLCVMKSHLEPDDFKYKTCDEFLEAYGGWFSAESEKEKNYLWQTANWMDLLFKMITARKNKGLAMAVIPKVVEGFDAKYVTGSGQTKATANRVHVFEVEGNTKANQRGKIRIKKKVLSPAEKRTGEDGEEMMKKRKKRTPKLPMHTSFVTPYDTNELGTRSREKRARDAIATIYEAAMAADTHHQTRGHVQQVNNSQNNNTSNIDSDEIKNAYLKLMRDSSCSSVLSSSGYPAIPFDYSRNISLGGLDPLNFIQLAGPSDLQRGYSWTEIPVNNNVTEPEGTIEFTETKSAGAASTKGSNMSLAEEDAVIERVLSSQSLSEMFTGYAKY